MKYNLALQTPTVTLEVKVRDAAGKADTLQVEFRRYNISEANVLLAEFDGIAASNQKVLSDLQESNGSIWESSVVNDATDVKDFVKKHIVDFKNVKGTDESGKVVKVNSVKAQGDLEPYFDMLWASFPYRDALRTATLQAIQNTSSNASLTA